MMDDSSTGIMRDNNSVKYLKSVFSLHRHNETIKKEDVSEDYIHSLFLAKQELDEIERLFNDIVDPDLIEYAIYREYAVKLKLSYLIKKAKENNVTSVGYTVL